MKHIIRIWSSWHMITVQYTECGEIVSYNSLGRICCFIENWTIVCGLVSGLVTARWQYHICTRCKSVLMKPNANLFVNDYELCVLYYIIIHIAARGRRLVDPSKWICIVVYHMTGITSLSDLAENHKTNVTRANIILHMFSFFCLGVKLINVLICVHIIDNVQTMQIIREKLYRILF